MNHFEIRREPGGVVTFGKAGRFKPPWVRGLVVFSLTSFFHGCGGFSTQATPVAAPLSATRPAEA